MFTRPARAVRQVLRPVVGDAHVPVADVERPLEHLGDDAEAHEEVRNGRRAAKQQRGGDAPDDVQGTRQRAAGEDKHVGAAFQPSIVDTLWRKIRKGKGVGFGYVVFVLRFRSEGNEEKGDPTEIHPRPLPIPTKRAPVLVEQSIPDRFATYLTPRSLTTHCPKEKNAKRNLPNVPPLLQPARAPLPTT